MAVLASRKHYCTNKYVRGADNIDEQCKLLLKDREGGCSEFKNVHKVKGHPSLQKGGCQEAHDIEDLINVGQVVKGCSYFAARSMAEDAQLVFCPYSYVINPIIRRAMEVDIRGGIIILDEAHNIEDIARDAGSMDVEEDSLIQLQRELEQLALNDAMTYQPLLEMTQDLLNWIDRRKNTLEKHEFQHYFSCWRGDRAIKELQEANISRQCFPILQECATKAIKASSDPEPEVTPLSGLAAIVLEGLFSSLNYFFSGDGLHVNDYQLALQRKIKRNTGIPGASWTHTLSLWCLNPSVVFREIADRSLSVILTSGTLSPVNSFSSELGIQFGTCLEAPHVIDVESQLWTAVISRGPKNYPLNASYKTADVYAFQDSLGMSLEEIFKIVPGGCLVFCPSYKLMEKLCDRWKETGQWSRLSARKSLFIEPRGCQDEFESVLRAYYNSIRRGSDPLAGRRKRVKKSDSDGCNSIDLSGKTKKGAALFAVCRGKVSEGIDFSDDNARLVIIIGIPFPNINDIKVAQKKKFNDVFKSSRNLLSGSDWYCYQAFRALNQATGRCIRHRFDYGAIIFLDERFCEARNTAYISKWLRKSIRQYDSFESSLDALKSFFTHVKDRVGLVSSSSEISDVSIHEIPSQDKRNGFSRRKNKKMDIEHSGKNEDKDGALVGQTATCLQPSSLYNSQPRCGIEVSISKDDNTSGGCNMYVDLECDSDTDSKGYRNQSMATCPDDPELTIIGETPAATDNAVASVPGTLSRDENSSSTIFQCSTELSDYLERPLRHSFDSFPTSRFSLITPERKASGRSDDFSREKESQLNLSVNSHVQRPRKVFALSSVQHLKDEIIDTCIAYSPGSNHLIASSVKKEHAVWKADPWSRAKHLNMESVDSVSPGSLALNSYGAPSSEQHVDLDQRLQISCSVCRNPLGLPANNFYIKCSQTSLSKAHLKSLLKETTESSHSNPSEISVLISDKILLDPRLYNGPTECVSGDEIWSKEDGCVFKTIFCPFCSDYNKCLGVQVMATDAFNTQLLNKIMLYFDHLIIRYPEASSEASSPASASSTGKMASPIPIEAPAIGSSTGRMASPVPIEAFSYDLKQQNSGGWRTTKSKMRLPKKGPIF